MRTTADTFRPRAAALSNAATVTWRNLLGYGRVPQAIFFASLQPVICTPRASGVR